MGYSAFDISRNIGNKLSQGIREAQDENLIEKILTQTQNDPQAMQDAMGKILSKVSPERQPAALNYLKSAYESVQTKQKQARERQAAKEAGVSPDLPPALQAKQYEANLENQRMKQYGLIPQEGQQQVNQPQESVQPTTALTLPNTQKPSAEENNPYARFTDGQLQQMAGDPSKRISEPAKKELDRRKEDKKLTNKKIELGLTRDSKVLEEADKVRARIPVEEAAVKSMRQAITEGDLSFFSGNNLAELTGFEWARDAYGKQFKTGAKTFLINNVSKFGARPNQYIEQQIADSLAKIGTSREGNLAALAMTEFDVDMNRKYIEMLDEASDDPNVPAGKLAKEAQKRMTQYVERKMTELGNTLFQLANPIPEGTVYVYDKNGNIAGSVAESEVDNLPEGYNVQ